MGIVMWEHIQRLPLKQRVRLDAYACLKDVEPDFGTIIGYASLPNEYGEQIESYVVELDNAIGEEMYLDQYPLLDGRVATHIVVRYDQISTWEEK